MLFEAKELDGKMPQLWREKAETDENNQPEELGELQEMQRSILSDPDPQLAQNSGFSS